MYTVIRFQSVILYCFFQATLSADVMQLETNINTTVMNVSRIFNTTQEVITNITGQALNGFLNDVSGLLVL